MKGKWVLILASIVLVGVCAGALSLLRLRTNDKPQDDKGPPVATERFLTLSAKLQGQTVVNVPVPIEGKLESLQVEAGAEVYEGQLLAEIKNEGDEGARQAANLDLEAARARVSNIESELAGARLEASRAAAEAARMRGELDRSTRNLQRQGVQISAGAISRQLFERSQKEHAQLEIESRNLDVTAGQADARLATLQKDLDAAKKTLEAKEGELEHLDSRLSAGAIHSPVNGTVSSTRGQPGDSVDPTVKDLIQIATDLAVMEAVAEPDPGQTAGISPGQTASVVVAEVPDEVLSGTVKFVDKGKIVVEFGNSSPAIRPGQTAQVRIRIGT